MVFFQNVDVGGIKIQLVGKLHNKHSFGDFLIAGFVLVFFKKPSVVFNPVKQVHCYRQKNQSHTWLLCKLRGKKNKNIGLSANRYLKWCWCYEKQIRKSCWKEKLLLLLLPEHFVREYEINDWENTPNIPLTLFEHANPLTQDILHQI